MVLTLYLVPYAPRGWLLDGSTCSPKQGLWLGLHILQKGCPACARGLFKRTRSLNRPCARAGHSLFFEGLRQLQPRGLEALALVDETLQLDLELAQTAMVGGLGRHLLFQGRLFASQLLDRALHAPSVDFTAACLLACRAGGCARREHPAGLGLHLACALICRLGPVDGLGWSLAGLGRSVARGGLSPAFALAQVLLDAARHVPHATVIDR